MTIVLLVLLTSIILFFLYVHLVNTDFDFISPNSIVYIMCLLSIGVAIFFERKVDFSVSIASILLVVLALVCFSIGNYVKPLRLRQINNLPETNIILYGRLIAFFSLSFVVLSTVLYYREVREVAGLYGYSANSTMGMLYYYRTATLDDSIILAQRSKIVGQMTIMSYAITYLVLIDFVKRLVYKRIRNNILTALLEIGTVIAAAIQMILSGGRTQFLSLIESFVFIFVFYYGKKTRSSISNRFLRKMLICVVLVYIAFYFLGSLTGKSSKLDFTSTLFIYAGSPIPAFSAMLNKEMTFANNFFGSDLFFGPYQLLNRMGFNIDIGQAAAPAVAVGSLGSNIYGSFGRYYGTIGIIGLVIVNLLLGILYNTWYRRLQLADKNIEFLLFVFLIAARFLFDYCIEERFFMSVLSLGSILRIIYGFVFWKLFSCKASGGKLQFQ